MACCYPSVSLNPCATVCWILGFCSLLVYCLDSRRMLLHFCHAHSWLTLAILGTGIHECDVQQSLNTTKPICALWYFASRHDMFCHYLDCGTFCVVIMLVLQYFTWGWSVLCIATDYSHGTAKDCFESGSVTEYKSWKSVILQVDLIILVLEYLLQEYMSSSRIAV